MTDEATAQEGIAPESEMSQLLADINDDESQVDEADEDDGSEPEQIDDEAETDDESEEVDGEDDEGEDDQEPEPEFDVLDVGGNKLEIPKGSVPENVLNKVQEFAKNLQGDYTRKTQEHAENIKAFKAQVEQVNKLHSLVGPTLELYSYGSQVQRDIQQLSKVDIQQLWQSDPDRARQVSDTLSAKQAEFNQIVYQVNQLEMAANEQKQQQAAHHANEGKAKLDAKYANFSTEIAPKLVDYVSKNYGMDRAEAESGWASNPAVTEMAYKAMKYDEMRSKAAKPAKTAKPEVKPMTAPKAKGTKPSSNDPNRWSEAEWSKKLGLV